MPSTVFVIIPVFNRLKFTLACLEYLARQSYHPLHIIVVDGGSTDETVAALRRDWPQVEVIAGHGELWWAGATRLGIERALELSAGDDDKVLLINNDTVIGPEYVATLARVSDRERAAVGALVVDSRDPSLVLDAGEFIEWTTYRFPVKTFVTPGETFCDQVDVLPGRGSLVPLWMIRQAGNVDAERFPHYIGDYDFFARVKSCGYRLVVTYETKIQAHIEETGIAPTTANLSFREGLDMLTSRKSMLNVRDHWRFIGRHAPHERRPWLKIRLLGRSAAVLLFHTKLRVFAIPVSVGCRLAQRAVRALCWLARAAYYITDRHCTACRLDGEALVKDGILTPWAMPGMYRFVGRRTVWWAHRPDVRPLWFRAWNPVTKPFRWGSLQWRRAGELPQVGTAADASVGRVRLGLVVLEHAEWIGGSIYIHNLVAALDQLPDSERPWIRLLGVANPTSPLAKALVQYRNVEWAPLTGGSEPSPVVKWLQRLRGRMVSGAGWPQNSTGHALDIIYPAGFSPDLDALAAARLYWITDFQHAHLPHLFSSEEYERRQAGMARIAAQNGTLVLSSQAALKDFQRLFPQATIRPRVWSFCSLLPVPAVSPVDPCVQYGLPSKYIYLPNQFWAHKNHLTAFRAIAALRRRGLSIPLVCTGLERDPRQPDHVPSLKRFVAEQGLDEQIRFLGMVPRDHQVEIFRHAAAVLQPSCFEGWSTVVEDTKSLGRPLIVSDIEVHREQVDGTSAVLFRVDSWEDLADVLEQLWPRLAPGPDRVAESQAQAHTLRRQVVAGRQFMAILQETMQSSA